MRALQLRPRPLPHFGSAAGEPRFSHASSPRALILSRCLPGLLGRPSSGDLLSSAAAPRAATTARTARLDSVRNARRSSCSFMGLLSLDSLISASATVAEVRPAYIVSGY